MASVVKLSSDDSPLVIILDSREFKRFSKIVKKRSGRSVDELYQILKVSKNYYKLVARVDMFNESWLAVITSDSLEELGNVRVSVDGLYAVAQKLKNSNIKLSRQLRYAFKVVKNLTKKSVFCLI